MTACACLVAFGFFLLCLTNYSFLPFLEPEIPCLFLSNHILWDFNNLLVGLGG